MNMRSNNQEQPIMRIERVADRLYCGGSMNDASTVHETIRQHGVTHILDLDHRCDCEKVYDTDHASVEVLHYEVPDDGAPRTHRWSLASLVFAYEVMREPNAILFIHCSAGRNRSVSICYGVLRLLGKTPDEARNLMLGYAERVSMRDNDFRPLKAIRYEEDIERAVERVKELYTIHQPIDEAQV